MIREYGGKTAVITGAANGLGRALARELALRKCGVALIDVDSSNLENVTEELKSLGARVSGHHADVGSEQAWRDVCDEITARHGAPHLLINNAAVSASASFANTPAAEFERIMRVNFLGTVYSCRAFLPGLASHGQGQIVNVSSCFAWLGYPGKTAYAASKGAIRAFSESLRLEAAGLGVGVTLLYPGPMATDLVRGGISDSEDRRAREHQFLMSRGLRTTWVARQCLDRVLNDPARIVIGLDYRLMDILARISPTLASHVMRMAAARAGF